MIKKLYKYTYSYTVICSIFLMISLIKAPFVQVDTDIPQFFNKGDSNDNFYQKIKSEFSS